MAAFSISKEARKSSYYIKFINLQIDANILKPYEPKVGNLPCGLPIYNLRYMLIKLISYLLTLILVKQTFLQ